MHELCHRCGGELAEGHGESPFCPHCGTPQLFLALENQSVETGGEPALMADGTASTGKLPPPRPQRVEWKTAMQCAALVACIGSALCLGSMRVDLLAPVSLMWIVFTSLITVGLYQKRSPTAWMDIGVGTRIGLLAGLCLAIGLGASVAGWGLVARFGLHSMGAFDGSMSATLQEAIRRSTTPVPADMLGLLKSPEFRAGMMLGLFAFLSGCLLLISALGGAIGGMLTARRRTVA